MNETKKETKTIILNGSKVWFAAIIFLIVHGGAGIWWASSINTRMYHVEQKVTRIEQKIETSMDRILREMKLYAKIAKSV